MHIALFTVPYDAGRRSVGVGRGPERLIEAGLAAQLREAGHDVRETPIELPAETASHEMARVVAVQRELARGVRDPVDRRELPVVLAGNCSTAVGTLAARPADAAVIWFDAHADFNTADTTTSGMLDGTAISMVTGRALQNLTATVPGFTPVDERRVVLVGARDLDPPETAALAASGVRRLDAATAPAGIAAAIRALEHERPAPPVYVHLDLDVLDPASARASAYAAPDGLTPEALVATLTQLAETAPLYAIAITAYDPSWDEDGRTGRIAITALSALLRST
jgi:arginase